MSEERAETGSVDPVDPVDPVESTESVELAEPAPVESVRRDEPGGSAEPSQVGAAAGSDRPEEATAAGTPNGSDGLTPGDSPDQPATDTDGTDEGKASDAPVKPGRRPIAARTVQAGVLISVLFALLGFGLVVQVRTNSSTSGIASARQDDLVRILDDLSSREDRLRQQIASLQAARRDLSSSGDKASAALAEARNRSTTLGILAGTVAATGPGVRLTINDPGNRLDAEDLLDAVEELRAAGAEAFQVGSVRIGMSSAFTDHEGVILVDGTPLTAPYVIIALGDPGTLATALNIPGGVVASARNAGAEALVTQRDRLVISALRPLTAPEYASPAPDKNGD